ncbi:MAG: hypothetical protein ABIK37_02255 [candidate division WOR-3 bacterium]
MRKQLRFIGCLLLLALVGPLLARSATPPPAGRRIYDMKWLNINRWECPFYNDGRYAIDITRGTGEAGGCWPAPIKNAYIFGAGLWFGSLKPRGDGRMDTLVTFGYNPNSGGTEMTPTSFLHAPSGAGATEDRIFVYPADWPPRPRDYFVTEGVPDSLVPTEAFSLQDMWCVYSDGAPENHISPGKPQGIEIYQTIYAWNYPSNQDVFFIIYTVRNAGTDTLKRCFMGAVCDPDVGDASDDMVGTLLNDSVPGVGWVRNVGFVGDNDNRETQGGRWLWEGGTPGVFAYKFLESPRDPEGNQLGMKAFKKFTIDIDPVTDPAQYLTMAGYDYRTGVYAPYDSALDIAPADKRFVQCSGPFDMAPGQVERLIVACIGAPFGGEGQPWADRFPNGGKDSLIHLARTANAAQFIYDQGWLLPGPPPSPNLTLVPGDNQVRIVWDNLPERTPDRYYEKVASDPGSPGYDPKYMAYDFQGYVVYKSKNGADWQILGQCDLVDSIKFSYPPGGDSSVADSLWLKATDNGIYYTLVDKNVTNGFTYYYCVAAYDWNYVTTDWDSLHQNPIAWDTLILRSGIVSNNYTVPRWDAPNYVPPVAEVKTVYGAQQQNALACTASVVVPWLVSSDTFELRFLPPGWTGSFARSGVSYTVTNRRTGEMVVDTTGFEYTVTAAGTRSTNYVPIFNGEQIKLTLKLAAPTQAFTAAQVSGSYPGDSLKLNATPPQQGWWAYRGSDYRVIWTNVGGYLTARVFDVTNGGIEVPYSAFGTSGSGPQRADGWCFVNKVFQRPSDTLKVSHAYLYVCGGFLGFRLSGDSLGSLMSAINDGDTWQLTGDRSGGAAPYYNVYDVVATPGYNDSTTSQTLNVKVVPNPYIVFNAWETTTEQRNLKFTHLPAECTIRIFTTSGDLLKVIQHKDTRKQPLDEGGTETWDLINDSQQLIASGVYIFHVESPVGEFTGKLMIVH